MKTLTLTLTYALLDSIPPIYSSSLTSFAHNCPGSRIANFTIKKKREQMVNLLVPWHNPPGRLNLVVV